MHTKHECYIVINDEDASGALCHICHCHVYDNAQSLIHELHCILHNRGSDVWHSLLEIQSKRPV